MTKIPRITPSALGDAYSSNWQAPPVDMMDMILQHTNFKDRIRLSTICKYWESVVKRRDIHGGKHDVPWLLLPQHSSNNNYLSFFSLSDANIYKLLLPRTQIQGASWVVLGSSKGWLIMKEDLGPDSYEIFLFNPITRAQHQLPSLKTIPFMFKCFQEYYVKLETQGCAEVEFCHQVVLSTSDIDSGDCLVAAVVFLNKALALCRPKDKSWTIVYHVPDEYQTLEDVLFSASGELHTLLLDDEANKNNMFTVTQSTINFGEDHVVVLRIVHDEINYNYRPRLLESATDNHVLLIHQMRQPGGGEGEGNEDNDNEAEGNEDNDGEDQGNEDDDDDDVGGAGEVEEDEDNDGEGNENNDVGGDDEEGNGNNQLRSYWEGGTSDFRIYKLDSKSNKFIETQCLGDQVLFLAEVGSLSLPASHHNKELERNCIIFATSTKISYTAGDSHFSHEVGIFNLNSRSIEQSFPGIDHSLRSQLESLIERYLISRGAKKLRWFTPSV